VCKAVGLLAHANCANSVYANGSNGSNGSNGVCCEAAGRAHGYGGSCVLKWGYGTPVCCVCVLGVFGALWARNATGLLCAACVFWVFCVLRVCATGLLCAACVLVLYGLGLRPRNATGLLCASCMLLVQ
jgi:hypothetical protein